MTLLEVTCTHLQGGHLILHTVFFFSTLNKRLYQIKPSQVYVPIVLGDHALYLTFHEFTN